MILPEGHEAMSDNELVEALVTSGTYDQDEAEAVVDLARHPQPGSPAPQ